MRNPESIRFELDYWMQIVQDAQNLLVWAEDVSDALPIEDAALLIPMGVTNEPLLDIADRIFNSILKCQEASKKIINKAEEMGKLAEGRFKALRKEMEG